MFIVSLTYTKSLELVDKFIPEHVEFLKKQYLAGHFQLSGRKEPRTGGIIIATVSSRNKLNEILALDPFYRESLATYDVTEMMPTMSSKALQFLVASTA
ncbi:YciI family protein [Vibrio ostreicida]